MKINRLLILMLCFAVMIVTVGCSTGKVNVQQQEKLVARVYGDYPEYSSVDELAEKADVIIEGTVVNSRLEEIDDLIAPLGQDEKFKPNEQPQSSKKIYTVYTIKVSDAFKGVIKPGETIEVKQIGGEGENVIYVADESVEFVQNKKYIMFLTTYENSPATLLNPIQSSYSYDEESATLKSGQEELVSVNEKNNLTLTVGDLEKIKEKNTTK